MTSEQTGGLEQNGLNSGADFSIRPLQTAEDAIAFRTLNEEWITKFFTLEGSDETILGNPREEIIARGGKILMAHVAGRAVGCVALVRTGGDLGSLAKMAVSPKMQGRGIGRALLVRAIEQAHDMGLRTLTLGSNTQLKSAVHLYESLGFVHLPVEQWPESRYKRGNVFMKLNIEE